MLPLTSYERMRRYLSAVAGSPLIDNYGQKNLLVNWINTVSKQIEKHLRRELLITNYIEYFDTLSERDVIFSVKAYPIIILTDVYRDSTGLWDSSNEYEIDDCYIGKNSDSVITPLPPEILGIKSTRIRYIGGMAYYGVKSLFTCTITGSWTINNFVYGNTSEAVGIIKNITATTLTIEILYGIFIVNETLIEYSDEGLTTATTNIATLDTITQQSLVEQYPDIVRACEIQVRHYWKHKDDFELISTQRDATNQKSTYNQTQVLTDEAIHLLEPYRKYSI
jgi:hypothetical protein